MAQKPLLHFWPIALAFMFAAPLAADTVEFGPYHSTQTGGSVSVDLVTAQSISGNGALTVTFFGDLNSANEYIDVFIEGTHVGQLTNGGQCGPDATATLLVPAAVMQSAAQDGVVSLTFDASDDAPGIDGVDAFCNASASSSANFSNGVNTAFALRGSLGYTLSAAGPPSGTAADGAVMANRGALILANGIDPQRRVERLQNGSALARGSLSFAGREVLGIPATLQVSRDGLGFAAGGDVGPALVWAEGRLSIFEDPTSADGRFATVHLGADWRVDEHLMLGIAGSVDRFEQTITSTGDAYSGTGWMIGPVLTAQIGEALFLDGRLAYGRAQNEVTRSGLTDEFASTRAMAALSVMGEVHHDALTFFPEVELAYFREVSENYTSATLGPVTSSDATLMQARFGGQAEWRMGLPDGQALTPYADAFAVYSQTLSDSTASSTFAQEIEGWSGELEIGFRYDDQDGLVLGVSAGVGGLFTDAQTMSAQVTLNITF